VVELADDVALADRGLRPFQGGERGRVALALARLEPVPAGAYRDVDHPVPVALVAAT
jgi:ABC-type hemin transport system ATPase subunit